METTRIDAVGLVRQIRDEQAGEWGELEVADVIAYFREAAARLRAGDRFAPESSEKPGGAPPQGVIPPETT